MINTGGMPKINISFGEDPTKAYQEGYRRGVQDAEAWAVGTRGGKAVPEDDPTHDNNARHYAAQMQETAEQVEGRQAAMAARLDAQGVEIATIRQQVASPFRIANIREDMTDPRYGYVYCGDGTGADSGMVRGSWYYWDGTTWARGGVATDKTLMEIGVAADSKAVGDIVRATTEESRNLWVWGDQQTEGTYIGIRNVNIPAGIYTLSGIATNQTGSNTRIQFWRARLEGRLAEPVILADGKRHSVTFELLEDCGFIAVLAGLSTETHQDVMWTDIQLERGEKMTPYLRAGLVAYDEAARKAVNVGNLWTYGDVEFDEKYIANLHVPAGEYVFSAVVDPVGDDYEPIGYRVAFCLGTIEIAVCTVPGVCEASGFVDLVGDADNIKLYASNTLSSATGHRVAWSKIQISPGRYQKQYLPETLELSRVSDYIGDDPCLIGDIKNWTFTKKKNIVFRRKHNNLSCIIITCRAKWEGAAGNPNAVPEISFARNADGLDVSAWYTLGNKEQFIEQQWRMPPITDDKRGAYTNGLFVRFNIPDGITVTIDHLEVRHDNTISRPHGSGLRIDTHLSFMAFPALSNHAFEAAARCGATNCIVIPKRSSDGVWFAYHDDTFDEATTLLRNTDGTRIAGSQYNGLPFSQIPWEGFLDRLDSGVYMNPIWAGTRLMTIDDFLLGCNKTGTHPVFSCHPTYTRAEKDSLRELVDNYGQLKNLTILPDGDWATTFDVFGNDVEMYKPGLVRGSTSAENLQALISELTATSGLDLKKVCIALWIDQATPELIHTIRAAGFRAGLHEYTHTSASGLSAAFISGQDYKYWQQEGVSVFMSGHNPSVGLNF